MTRRAPRVDRNQPAIVAALRAAGAQVIFTHMVAAGFPDLIVNASNRSMFMEIKDGAKCPSGRRLTEAQQTFHAEWRGGTLATVTDIEGALRALAVLRA